MNIQRENMLHMFFFNIPVQNLLNIKKFTCQRASILYIGRVCKCGSWSDTSK